MREIEFRVWDYTWEVLGQVTDVEFIDGKPFWHFDFEIKGTSCKARSSSLCVEISQYTGLRDKNGKKIFEGDIGWDEFRGEYNEIIFHEGKFIAECENIAYDLWEVTDDIEVIGNKWENPDLLEAG